MSNKPSQSPQPQTTLGVPSVPHVQPTFISAYSPKLKVALTFPEQGREKQSFKDECDINNIMRRFQATGELTHLAQRPPLWGEIPELDFAGAMGMIVDARERFQQLPAVVRDRFNNDPAQLLAFVQDESNRAEAIKLGLIPAPEGPAKAPEAPPPVSPTGAPTPTAPSAS